MKKLFGENGDSDHFRKVRKINGVCPYLPFILAIFFAICPLLFAQEQAEKNNANLRLYPFKEELKKAEDYAKAQNWSKAVEIFTDAVKSYPNQVVQSEKDKNLYLGVEEYVLRAIAQFPEDGRKAYRQQIDPMAKKYLDEARATKDIGTLEMLLSKYQLSTFTPNIAE